MKLQQLHVSDWIDMTNETRVRIIRCLSAMDPKAALTSIALRIPQASLDTAPLPQTRIVLDVADVIALLSDR